MTCLQGKDSKERLNKSRNLLAFLKALLVSTVLKHHIKIISNVIFIGFKLHWKEKKCSLVGGSLTKFRNHAWFKQCASFPPRFKRRKCKSVFRDCLLQLKRIKFKPGLSGFLVGMHFCLFLSGNCRNKLPSKLLKWPFHRNK